MEKIIRFFKDEDGMELSEYAVVGGLLLLVAAGVFLVWGQNLDRIFQAIRDVFVNISTT
jgi:Flp pilus assembly pilin Flp